MKPFNIKLAKEHRDRLDAYRAARGLRSDADAVRDLIDRYWPGAVEAKHEAFFERVETSIAQGARGVRPVRGAFRLGGGEPVAAGSSVTDTPSGKNASSTPHSGPSNVGGSISVQIARLALRRADLVKGPKK